MDGEGGDLEIDSELVMSFYDQCHADDLHKAVGVTKSHTPDNMVELKPPAPQVWNLPDLLVGLDGINNKFLSHSPLSIPPITSVQEISPARSVSAPQDSKHSFLFETFRQQTDSLLEGLGILGPSSQTVVKTEAADTPPPTQEYNGLEGLELEMAPFELNLTPKSEPVTLDLNLAQPCLIQNLPTELVNGSQILNVTIPSQYRSPPPLIQASTTQSQLNAAVAVATQDTSHFTVTPTSNGSHHSLSDVNLDSLESLNEDEDLTGCDRGLLDPADANPSYKRCHLCVRIFSTKANLSSHIRHVHLGEAKHSRVKSIPCPHCQKMFSRKGHMTEHVRTVHEGKKRIYKEVNCQHCGKTFRRKWGLNIHISSAHADVVSTLVRQ